MSQLPKSRIIGIAIITVAFSVIAFMIGPMDFFTHGFFCEKEITNSIPREAILEQIDLGKGDYEISFVPQRKFFAGFLVYIINPEENHTGSLILSVKDRSDRTVEEIPVALSEISSGNWFQVNTSTKYREGQDYTLTFSARDFDSAPRLQSVTIDYVSIESTSGNILLDYAYAKSDFTRNDKILIYLFMLAFWGMIVGYALNQRCFLKTGLFLFITVVLTWNYLSNTMDYSNDSSFSYFQADSETLVTGTIEARKNDVWFDSGKWDKWNLGRYYDVSGQMESYSRPFLTDGKWKNGYSITEPAFIIPSTPYSQYVTAVNNYVQFANGDIFQIAGQSDDWKDITVRFSDSGILSEEKNGSLEDIVFYDCFLNQLPEGLLTPYRSQVGLQGKVFRILSNVLFASGSSEDSRAYLYLFCSFFTALTFTAIIFLLFYKYNLRMAVCFFLTFWLSPWIVNFARNLYWVEFTWFLPMAAGLFCALKINHKKYRILSYLAAFVTVFIKSLCGYEYMTVILLGMIAFPLIDLLMAVFTKQTLSAKRNAKSILFLGIMGLCGFTTALLIHAKMRGEGSLHDGLTLIYQQDVLRRVGGASLTDMPESVWRSLNASVWETLCKYFHFPTQIITGIDGNLFPLLCCIPLGFISYDFFNKNIDPEMPVMYCVFFISSTSWFVLAKSHSFLHGHMNYVLWYCGFIQICFYIILTELHRYFRKDQTAEISQKMKKQ